MPLSAKFKITYSKSNAAVHKVVKLLAKQAFMYSDDLQGFINGVKYDVTAWGESHAKRKQTLASVHYEATENTFVCQFMSLSKGREFIFKVEPL